MKTYRIIILFFILSFTGALRAQENSVFPVHFRVNSTVIDSAYMGNSKCLKSIAEYIKKVTSTPNVSIAHITFGGAASPEGSYELNRRLAKERADAVRRFVCSLYSFPDSIITVNDHYIQWDSLKRMVERDNLVKQNETIDILDGDAKLVSYHHDKLIDRRVLQLQQADNGRTWKTLYHKFFPSMRNACATFVAVTLSTPPRSVDLTHQPVADVPATTPTAPNVVAPFDADTLATEVRPWTRHLYLKTNFVEWTLAISNIAGEIDLARHWSFALPFSYSAWDYFKSTIKFRTIKLQPELRYWPAGANDGWFGGVHFGLAWYNLAIDGPYRKQDKDGHTPAVGGGVSLGYRMPVSKNRRWKMEFSLGGGIYHLHYDTFHNPSNYHHGQLVYTKSKTYYGIDNVAVSLAYTFNLPKKGQHQKGGE